MQAVGQGCVEKENMEGGNDRGSVVRNKKDDRVRKTMNARQVCASQPVSGHNQKQLEWHKCQNKRAHVPRVQFDGRWPRRQAVVLLLEEILGPSWYAEGEVDFAAP